MLSNLVTHFRVRVTKVGYLRGPNYVQDSQWRDCDTVAGEFTVDLVGPGIYQAIVAADGWAIARSEPVNTDTMGTDPITVQLTRGVEIRGTVVDEQGQPIDGATVAPLSASTSAMAASAGPRPRTAVPYTGGEGAVKTSKGAYQLALVPAGTEMLRVTHPEYCFAFSNEIAVGKENIDLKPIVLTRGGTVRGTVYDADGRPEPNVSIVFHDANGYGGTDDEQAGRLATAVTDKNGAYEVRHLPSQLCYVHRTEEWNANGVVRTAVLPANGEVRTLDFGGPRGVTGRLLVNGQPVANTRVQLGGVSPHFGIFKAYAETDADGRFTLGRPPAGRRTLWRLAPGRRSDWIRSGEVTIDDTTTDLGEIAARAAVVAISVTGLSPAELGAARVSLLKFDPEWLFTGSEAGVVEPRKNNDGAFMIRGVPVGTCEGVLYRSDNVALRQTIEVTDQQDEQSVSIAWPDACGTLVVQVAAGLVGPGFSLPKLRSTDGKVHGYLSGMQPVGGELRFEKLPAGDYYLTDQDVRDAGHVVDFKIAANETTTLEVNAKTYAPPPQKLGMAIARCFNEQGVPLVGCEVSVRGDGAMQRTTERDGQTTIIADPGQYTLTVTFPGYDDVERTINVAAPAADGRIAGNSEIDVLLLPKR